MKWVVINKHSKVKSRFGKYTPVDLNEYQDILRIDESNEGFYSDHIKYPKDRIEAFRLSGRRVRERVSDRDDCFVRGTNKKTVAVDATKDFKARVATDRAVLESIEIAGQTDLVKAEFIVIDDPNGTYTGTPNGEILSFGESVNIKKDCYKKTGIDIQDLRLNMWIVIRVTNSSPTSQTMAANIELREVK